MRELQALGVKNITDKADVHHSFKGVSYLDVYESYFAPVREQTRVVLELGVLAGHSLMTWRDYFPNAEVWGIDIDPACNMNHGPRTHVVTGSQADPEAIAKAAPGQEFDIVVDDGSHLVVHLIESFKLIWPRVRPGGYYVMEDLGCTYFDTTPWSKVWPGQHYNPEGTDFNNNRAKLNEFFFSLIQPLDGLYGDVRFVHFHPMQCFIRKVEL
jgi:hypothetical protein